MTDVAGVPSDLIRLSAVLGTAVPLVAALVKQDRLSKRANAVIAMLVSLVVAGVSAAAVGHFSFTSGWDDLFGSFIAIYTVAVATYKGFWHPTGIEPALQTATSAAPKAIDPTVESRTTDADRTIFPQ